MCLMLGAKSACLLFVRHAADKLYLLHFCKLEHAEAREAVECDTVGQRSRLSWGGSACSHAAF